MAQDRKVIHMRVPTRRISLEAELCVLGGLMQAGERWPAVSRIVRESDFYEYAHRLLFACMRTLAEKGIPIDICTLGFALEEAGIIDKVGNWAYLNQIDRDTPSAANLDYYAIMVRTRALERRRDEAISQEDHEQAAAITAAIKALTESHRAVPLLPTINTILVRSLDHDWLVEGFIERRQTTVLFGDSQTCKSLLAIDIGCCLATAIPWRGCDTHPGAVLYIVGEGAGGGVTRRFTAWQIANQRPLTDCPLFFQETTTTLPDDLERLITEIRCTLECYGWKLELIILDTLSRTISGSERESRDFGQYQRSLDRLRQEFECAVLFIHHTGHVDKGRERGASEIGCNADVRLAMDIVDNDIRRLRALKVKDGDTPPDKFFAIAPVELGKTDQKGNTITSVVLRALENYQPPAKPEPLGKHAITAFLLLQRLVTDQFRTEFTGNDTSPVTADTSTGILVYSWRQAFYAADPDTPQNIRKMNWNRAIRELQSKGLILLSGINNTRVTISAEANASQIQW